MPDLARKRLAEIDSSLPGNNQATSTADVLRAAAGDAEAIQWKETVLAAFKDYARLKSQCEKLREVSGEITRHVARQQQRLKYRLVLNEAETRELVDIGREHELQSQQCCAFLAFEEAIKSWPSPSGQLAYDRLAEMQRAPEIVAAAKACEELQWCHKTYRRAERLADPKPEKALDLFRQIMDRAPRDSKIFEEARDQVRQLRRQLG